MAKQVESVSFSNAQIDIAADEIAEMKKDEIVVSSLSEVLKQWDGIEGVSITIKKGKMTSFRAGAGAVDA